jgi:ferrochelatase
MSHGFKTHYDALLVVSFGGPEGMDDVIPFLENVLRGRNVPRERMLQVAHHYEMFGGVSPINQQNRELIAALGRELESNGPPLPIYWGNRNWHPLLPDTLRKMASDGVRNALAFVTSAYSSYSSCRQYLQNIADAQAQVGPTAPRVEKLRVFYNHPLFIQANVDHIREAWAQVNDPESAHLVFTAHSIPESMAANCDYAMQLEQAATLIAVEYQELGARLSESQWLAVSTLARTGYLRSPENAARSRCQRGRRRAYRFCFGSHGGGLRSRCRGEKSRRRDRDESHESQDCGHTSGVRADDS